MSSNEMNAIFIYNHPKCFSKFANLLIQSFNEIGIIPMGIKTERIKDFQRIVEHLCAYNGSFEYRIEWGFGNIIFHNPKEYRCLENNKYAHTYNFKKFFMVIIEINLTSLYEPEDVFEKKFNLMHNSFKSFFNKTGPIFGYFPNLYPDYNGYYPIEKDIVKGTIATWFTMNFLSKEILGKIKKSFLPSEEHFERIELENGGIEYFEKSEDCNFGEIHITDNKFLDRRFSKQVKVKYKHPEEIENEINRIKRMVWNEPGTGFEELRILSLPKDRLINILKEIAKRKMKLFIETGGGTLWLAEAAQIFRIIGDKEGNIRVAKIFLELYEKESTNGLLEASFEILEMGNVRLDYVKENQRNFYDKLIKFQKQYEAMKED